MGSVEGALRTAAVRLGIEPDAYVQHVLDGKKWCGGCRSWHPRSAFGADARRADGLMAVCREARRKQRAERFVPVPAERRRQPRPPRAEPRDGDAVQARHRINYAVAAGRMPAPRDLPCVDCGHVWVEGERRHEYDHHRGYAAEHHEAVEPVCSLCHAARERARS